jgi:hypothetical protein
MGTPRKRIGYWAWKEAHPTEQHLLQPPETDLYHPAKHYDLGEMCYQGEKHLEHAITAAGGDGFYDKKRMHAAAIRELVNCDMQEFCSALR